MFLIIVNQIIKMLLLMLVGCLCYRLKLIDEQGNKTLANILLMVINPVLAVTALQTDYPAFSWPIYWQWSHRLEAS